MINGLCVATINCTLGKAPNKFLGKIFEDIENKVLNGELVNDKKVLKEYVKLNY